MIKSTFISLLTFILVCAGTLDVFAANVIVTVKDSDGNPIQGVKVERYTGSSWGGNPFSNTDVNGISNANLSGNNYIRVTYKNTQVSTAYINFPSGTADYELPVFYTTGITFDAKSGSTPISGVSIQYTAGGSTTNQSGSTDINGLYKIEMFPGTYTYSASKSYTGQSYSITVNGDGYTQNVSQIENISLTKVNFHNYGAVSLKPSCCSNQAIGSGKAIEYMFAGTYNLRFHTGTSTGSSFYTKDVVISGDNYDKVASIILVKDHNNNNVAIDNSNPGRGGYNTPTIWNLTNAELASDQGDGVYIHLSDSNVNTNRTFEIRKNKTMKTITQDVMTNNVFNFKTDLLTLYLKDCNGTGLVSSQVRYGYNQSLTATGVSAVSNFFPGNYTDANGMLSMEAFPGTFSIEMKINQSTEVKADVIFTGSEDFTWTTTNVKFHYPGQIVYGGSGTSAFFPISKEAEMLPGIVNFSFRYSGENIIAINVPASTQGVCNNYEKTVVIARLVNSSNAPLAGGTATYYENPNWYNIANPTAANGNTVYFLNGSPSVTTVRMNYLGSNQQKGNINLASVNNVVVFQTILITMTLVDKDDNPIEADSGTLQYYSGGWKIFGSGSTTGGSESMELLAASSGQSFSMRLNGTLEQKTNWNTITNPIIPFKASKVWIHYISNCLPKSGVAATYYALSWISMGTTDVNGNSNAIDMLPGGNYSFKAGSLPQQNGIVIQGIGVDQIVNFAEGDTINPQITTCPPNHIVSGCGVSAITGLLYSETPVSVTLADFTSTGGVATDNCDIVSYSYSDVKSSNDCNVLVTRTWLVKDASGNEAICTQNINIKSSLMITNPMIRSRVK